MGKLAMDGAIITPPSSLTESLPSASTPPPPSFVECKNPLSHSILFSPASAVADSCCASPRVAPSSCTDVDLMPSSGYSALGPYFVLADLHVASPSASPHAGNYISSSGNHAVRHADMHTSKLCSSTEIGSITSFSGNVEMGSDMHAPPLPCPLHAAVSSSFSSRSFRGDSQICTPSLSSSHCMESTPANNLADACLCASFSAQNLTSDGVCARRAFLCSYMNSLLPALRRIQSQSVCRSFEDKVTSVKLAADMSLAISAGSDTAWSKALLEKVASSSPCRPPRKGSRGRRKTTRTLLKKTCFSSALRKRSRGRSTAHALGNHSSGSYSLLKPFVIADMVSHDGHGFTSSVKCGRLSMEPLPAQCQIPKCRRHVRPKGVSSYRRILRSMRCKRKQRIVNVTSSQDAKANRGSSMAISKAQIVSLGELVPGGCNMDVPILLEEAADYILTLQMQVEALQSLCRVISI